MCKWSSDRVSRDIHFTGNMREKRKTLLKKQYFAKRNKHQVITCYWKWLAAIC